MLMEAFGMFVAIAGIVVSAIILRVVFDAIYIAMPENAKKFVDTHF